MLHNSLKMGEVTKQQAQISAHAAFFIFVLKLDLKENYSLEKSSQKRKKILLTHIHTYSTYADMRMPIHTHMYTRIYARACMYILHIYRHARVYTHVTNHLATIVYYLPPFFFM